MDAVGDIKSKLNLEDVVAEYMELKPSGSNLKALSPFTQEKTPSFMVSPEKQIWHDFSSNKGGDMFTFIQEIESVEFKEALNILARKAGVDLSQHQKGTSLSADKRERLEKANQAAANFYQQQLLRHKHALEYVTKKRGFKRGVIEAFGIGFAPAGGQSLSKYLASKGFTDKELVEAGLCVNRQGRVFDMFRDRVLVALADRQGKIIGFTGRILSNDPNAPKYINTAQTKLYDKSRHVFGLHLAKQAIRDQDLAIMVEGNLDVVSAHQAGYTNVVATAGTAMTTQQLRQLKYVSKNLAFAFDSDAAGLRATLRAIPLAQAEDMELSVIILPEGKDPDDIISESPQKWEELVSQKKYAVDWVLDYYRQQHDISTATGKSAFAKEAAKVINAMSDPVEKDHYVKQVAEAINSSVAAITQLVSQKSSPKLKKTIKAIPEKVMNQKLVVENALLGLTLVKPKSRLALTQLEVGSWEGSDRQKVFSVLKKSKAPVEELLKSELKDLVDFVKILQLIGEERFGDWQDNDASVEADQLALRLMKFKTEQEKEQLSHQIAEAESSGDLTAAKKLLERWHEINATGGSNGQ